MSGLGNPHIYLGFPPKRPVKNENMSWIKKNRLLVILVALAAFISLAASITNKAEIPVRVGKVERESIVNTISTNGKIEPSNNFQGRAVGPSLVRKVFVHEGDRV